MARSTNRNQGASNPNRGNSNNSFTNPVGSVTDPLGRNNVSTQEEQELYTVVGTGGSERHKGYFSQNNPYYNQLQTASNNEDKDALYELAIQWEADYANLEEQRGYNRGVLEEQREYDSPLAQVQRAREAGINPDIAANSGSGINNGSSAQMQLPQMADQQGQTKFNNKYDNINNIFNGINATASFVGSLASGVSAVTNSFSQLKMLPSQIALNEANAALGGAQANEINQLLQGKKKSMDISNIQGFMGIMSNMSQLLSPAFTDEEGGALATSLGIQEEEIPTYLNAVRQIHKKPEILANFEKSQLEYRKEKAKNTLYDQRTLDEMENLRFKNEEVALQLEYASTALQEKVAYALLTDEDYANNVVKTETTGAKFNRVETQIAYEQALHDADAWGEMFDNKVELVRNASIQLDAIRTKAEQDGKWTEEELYNYNTALASYVSLRNLTSQEFGNMKRFMMEVLKTRYDRMSMLDDEGNVRNLDMIGALQNFSNVTFNDVYNNTVSTGEIVRGWINTSAGAIRDASLAVGGAYQGGNFIKGIFRSKVKGFQ